MFSAKVHFPAKCSKDLQQYAVNTYWCCTVLNLIVSWCTSSSGCTRFTFHLMQGAIRTTGQVSEIYTFLNLAKSTWTKPKLARNNFAISALSSSSVPLLYIRFSILNSNISRAPYRYLVFTDVFTWITCNCVPIGLFVSVATWILSSQLHSLPGMISLLIKHLFF